MTTKLTNYFNNTIWASGLMALLLCLPSILQGNTNWEEVKTITGTVISSEDALPLIGVTVAIKGTTTGAVTDVNGNWSMKFEPGQGDWIQATSNVSGAFWNMKLNNQQSVYDIDFSQARGTTLLPEVVISAEKPKPKPEPQPTVASVLPSPSWFQKNWWWVVGSAVLTTGLIVFFITRDKDKKKK